MDRIDQMKKHIMIFERIERIEKILIQLVNLATQGTGMLYSDLKNQANEISDDLEIIRRIESRKNK